MEHDRRWWIAALALLAVLLVPIFIGPYPPMYDYQNHLLEAQIVARWDDRQLGYADNYTLRPRWYLQSNALSTLLLIGLGQMMPIAFAGQLVLGGYLALFVGGLAMLLRRVGNSWLLLLSPVLAYNTGFTSGWLNFVYGAALALHALVVYDRWRESGRRWTLALLALLMLLIYIAHLVAWVLTLLTIAALSGAELLRAQRRTGLLMALNSATPLIAMTRPALATVALLIAPAVWIGFSAVRRLRLSPRAIGLGTLALATGIAVAIKLLKPLRQQVLPAVDHNWWQKIEFPLLTWTLPHQFMPPEAWLVGYNALLLVCLFTIAALLVAGSLARRERASSPWLATLAVFVIAYVALPSQTYDVLVVEPRILLFGTFVGLACVRFPPVGSLLYRMIVGALCGVAVLSVGGFVQYAVSHNRQAKSWEAQLDQLSPARTVLMLRPEEPFPDLPPPFVRAFNRFYTGEFFSTRYTIDHGGFHSRTFTNGPIEPQPRFAIPLYYWPPFSSARFVEEQCAELQTTYDAVLVWGAPEADLRTQLDRCFGPARDEADMTIWKRDPRS